jgi:hypothetical protein
VSGITDEHLGRVLPNGWTISVTLAHLAFWDQRVIHVIELGKMDGKITPSNFDDSLNDVLEPFLHAIPPQVAVQMAVNISGQLDEMLEEIPVSLIEQLEAVNHRWVDRSLHRNGHLDDIENGLKF